MPKIINIYFVCRTLTWVYAVTTNIQFMIDVLLLNLIVLFIVLNYYKLNCSLLTNIHNLKSTKFMLTQQLLYFIPYIMGLINHFFVFNFHKYIIYQSKVSFFWCSSMIFHYYNQFYKIIISMNNYRVVLSFCKWLWITFEYM